MTQVGLRQSLRKRREIVHDEAASHSLSRLAFVLKQRIDISVSDVSFSEHRSRGLAPADASRGSRLRHPLGENLSFRIRGQLTQFHCISSGLSFAGNPVGWSVFGVGGGPLGMSGMANGNRDIAAGGPRLRWRDACRKVAETVLQAAGSGRDAL